MRTSSTCWIIAVAVLFCVVTVNLVDYADAQKGLLDMRKYSKLDRLLRLGDGKEYHYYY